MKKTLFLTIVFCAICFLPFGAQAIDAKITSIELNIDDNTAEATATYTGLLEIGTTVANGSSINLLFSIDGTFTPNGDFDLSGATFSAEQFNADLVIEPVGDGSLRLDLQNDLFAGNYYTFSFWCTNH